MLFWLPTMYSLVKRGKYAYSHFAIPRKGSIWEKEQGILAALQL